MEKDGTKQVCSYCNKDGVLAVSVFWLSNRIHRVIEEQYYLTSTDPEGFEATMHYDNELSYEWERSGDSISVVISDLVGIDDVGEIIDDVSECLSTSFSQFDPKDFGEDPYSDDARYESYSMDGRPFHILWDTFQAEIKSRARFSNRHADKILLDLFSGLEDLKTRDNETVVQTWEPKLKTYALYRARVAMSDDELEDILKQLPDSIGAPPTGLANSGRMNANGISVFYGAEDPQTCIAEIRPPVGSQVVLGCFDIVRKLRMLQLNLLEKICVQLDRFDPAYVEVRERQSFLKYLVGDLTKPVLPHEEPFEYLQTQYIAEFLSEHMGLDGIVFDSSQSGGEGKNVVLFNHACRGRANDKPKGARVTVGLGHHTSDGFEDDITIFNHIPKNPKDEHSFGLGGMFRGIFSDDDSLLDSREVTLNLRPDNLQVFRISSVEYGRKERDVSSLDVPLSEDAML
jgi:hypothetical protein